jgi:hypothetical protein
MKVRTCVKAGHRDSRCLRGVAILAVIEGWLTVDDADAQAERLSVSTDRKGAVRVTTPTGLWTIPKERGQVGIEEVQIAGDGRTAGWLVTYGSPAVTYDIAGTLVVWRGGRIIQRFPGRFQEGPVFWSWSFVADGKQVAYHTGPLHFESTSHCYLHNVSDGRLVAQWDGKLDDDSATRPAWTAGLRR